jgi:hypothetical protein
MIIDLLSPLYVGSASLFSQVEVKHAKKQRYMHHSDRLLDPAGGLQQPAVYVQPQQRPQQYSVGLQRS